VAAGDVKNGAGLGGIGPLDRVPPLLRSLLEMMVATALMWAGTEVVPWMQGRGGYTAVLAPVAVAAIEAGTTLTRQYGVGSGNARLGKSHRDWHTEDLGGRHEQ
jgi:hypothetical protein